MADVMSYSLNNPISKSKTISGENPYDSLGVNHNILLDSVRSFAEDDWGDKIQNFDFESNPLGNDFSDSIVICYIKRAFIETGIDTSITVNAIRNSVKNTNIFSDWDDFALNIRNVDVVRNRFSK